MTGRAANASNLESAAELSTVTRWKIGGSGTSDNGGTNDNGGTSDNGTSASAGTAATGLQTAIPIAALLLVCAAVAMRRRLARR